MSSCSSRGKLFTWVLIAGVAAVMLAVYSCGGSDDDGATLPDVNVSEPDSELAHSAAQNEPVEGSVTQGSRGAGVTTDRVRYVEDDEQVEISGTLLDWTGDEGGARTYAADNHVAVVATRVTGVGGSARKVFNEDDSLFFGFWSVLTGGVTGVWGMFVDGDETESGQIPETETCYSGRADIIQQLPGESVDDQDIFMDVSVRLSDGIASGRMTEGTRIVVYLQDASRESADSLLFKGNAIVRDESDDPDPLVNIDGGNWGLQFFDGVNVADRVGGTVGVSKEDPEGNGFFVAVGTFYATRGLCP